MIWDLHCHIAGLGGRTPDESMAAADRAGRPDGDRASGHLHGRSDGRRTRRRQELRRQNDQVLQALSPLAPPGLRASCTSVRSTSEASLREIDRCVRDGPMVGLKLWVASRCDCPRLMPWSPERRS